MFENCQVLTIIIIKEDGKSMVSICEDHASYSKASLNSSTIVSLTPNVVPASRCSVLSLPFLTT